MPRPLRINYPNAWYHVMNRGASRQKIFNNNSHRLMFLSLLEQCHHMFSIKICAYCLMDNHYHLLVSTPEANLSRAMRHLNGVYTQQYNRSLKKDGSLFRGRYKAQLIEDDSYQLIVSRYIHLNPVEAGLVTHPADYKWSSYSAYLGLVKTPSWLSKDIILKQITEIKSLSQVINYQDYVEGRNINDNNVSSLINITEPILGSEVFKENILSKIDVRTIEASASDVKRARTIPPITFIIECVCVFYCIDSKSLMHTKRGTLNYHRAICMYISRKYFGHTLRAISESFECSCVSTISSAIRKFDIRLQQKPNLRNELNVIYNSIKKVIHEKGLPSCNI
jgi:putative transposase